MVVVVVVVVLFDVDAIVVVIVFVVVIIAIVIVVVKWTTKEVHWMALYTYGRVGREKQMKLGIRELTRELGRRASGSSRNLAFERLWDRCYITPFSPRRRLWM